MKRVCLLMALVCMMMVSCKPETAKFTVVTKSIENIERTTAKVIGQVLVDDVVVEVSEKGICWNVEGNPTIVDFRTKEGSGVGAYTSTLTDLREKTKYYIRAYATNGDGVTIYGEEMSFSASLPLVTTNEVCDITQITAVCGGVVELDGGSEVIKRGVCWSTSPNPQILYYDEDATIDGGGIGNFTSTLAGLNIQTTYYVRAYAKNSNGISYGEERSFTTSAAVAVAVDLGLSVKWATCNVGADSPENYGKCVEYKNCITDVAYMWGGNWRLPTGDEMRELVNKCTWTWTTQNGVKGYSVTGSNGNSIFLPIDPWSGHDTADYYGYYLSSSYSVSPEPPYSRDFLKISRGEYGMVGLYDYQFYRCMIRPVVE